MLRRLKKFGFYLLGALLFGTASVQAAENIKSTANTTIRLFSDGHNKVIAQTHINDGWHIYWRNPGEIGKPTVISAQNSDVKVLNQSTPEVHQVYEVLNEYLYKRTVFFDIFVPKLQNARLTFSFVECSDICKPEKLSFDLSKIKPSSEDEWQKIKATAEATFPQKIKLTSPIDENRIRLELPAQEIVQFIPAESEVIDTDTLQIKQKNKQIDVRWQTLDEQKLKQALLITPEKAYIADIVYTDTPHNSLWYILLLAFLGGIILNAMPCVFPILSLKIFSLLKNTRNKGRYQRAGAYILGVWSSFMLLTAVLVHLKKQGEAIGWGFQLQSPWFVGLMAALFLLMFFFMIEWLHFPNMAAQYIHKAARTNAFTTGFFAVLIAAPCTGPFMGAAVGYAFMQNSARIFAVFTALALGYALPYALIELYPKLLHKILPRPGKWMQKIKYLLSVPILLTSVWLFWVLGAQLHTGFRQNNINTALQWQNYDTEEVSTLAESGEKVFIDFTADWCLTCQFNEKILLQSSKFENWVKQNNVHLFRADLTEDNDTYDAALSAYGRDGIPVYIYYTDGTYRILPIFFSVDKL